MSLEFEQYRDTYSFEIPVDVLFEWLKELGWDQLGVFDAPPLVRFYTAGDEEDSWFEVCGESDGSKTSLPEAIKLAYFKMQDNRKNERRRRYEELSKEFGAV